MKINNIFVATALVSTISGCTTMDQYPEDSVSPEMYFQTEIQLRQNTNNFYRMLAPSAGKFNWYEENSELLIKDTPTTELLGSRSIPSNGSDDGWGWGQLRHINYFLQNSYKCADVDARNRYDGVAYFFRALFYANRLVMFGEVPLYDTPIGSADTELLMKPRDSRDAVINHILEDCDRAFERLPKEHMLTDVNAWTALALKSRIALFEGTFRKYHDGDPFNPDHLPWEPLLRTCAEASKKLITEGGYKLYKNGSESYRDLFMNPMGDTDEYIWARIGTTVGGIMHEATNNSISEGYAYTKRFMNLFLKKDGTRFTDDPNWKTMNYYEECQNRDPRLAQIVLCPGYKQKGDPEETIMNFSNTKGAYQYIKYVGDASEFSFRSSKAALPIFRIAEIYLNYAEALAELGTLTQTDLDLSVNKLRERAGMPDLKMDDANNNPDSYMMSEEWGYPNVTRSANTGVILEIRRERLIELSLELVHYNDILRWKEGKVYEKPFYGMYFPGSGKYDINGDGQNDIWLYEGRKPNDRKLKLFQIGKDIILSEGSKGFAVRCSIKAHERHWDENKDYLYPIPTTERILTNGSLTQNPGWDDKLEF